MSRAASFLLLILLVSCNGPRIARQVPPCPPPPPDPACEPSTFKGTTWDTSRVMNGLKWQIKRVQNAEGPDHEWGLLVFKDEDLLLWGPRASMSAYLPVIRERVDRIEQTSRRPSGTSDMELITVVADEAIMGDASIVNFTTQTSQVHPTMDPASPLAVLNMPVHFDGHPAISTDGTIVIFASDRPGSIGGTDLWYSIKTNDTWSTPQPVEGGVNTPCDELSPMFAGDSVVVFASAGHATVGGYDLFAADIVRSSNGISLSTPRNLGRPINTEFDELFPVWVGGHTLYYGSDQPRTAGGQRKDFDVFVLTSRVIAGAKPEPPTTQKPRRATVTGTVVNQQTQKPVADADVTAREAESREVVASTTTDTAGNYAIDIPVGMPIDIAAQAPDLFYEEKRITVEPERVNDTVRLEEPIAIPEVLVLRVNFPTAIFDDPYPYTLDSNGVQTTQAWEEALDLLARNVALSGEKLRRLVLIGHTDDVDTDESNMILGRNRVNFIMDELVERGIPRSMMEGRSAGETLLPDKRAGESIDLWRKRARRVELVKVFQD